ncbi:MAG: DUF1573 domain-containing protein [Desulfobacterota bacterium]|jgi:hypothetical protein|nr:DUF1573 domain-containing protein [Thermodesulfobacteriota bacterium]
MKVVRFDPHIQPGGQGEIVIALDPETLDGKFERYFKVISNDPQRPVILIKVYGFSSPFRVSQSPSKSCNF